MNMGGLINMVLRMFMRRAINKGISKGIGMATSKGKKPAGPALKGRESAKRARQAARITRRLGR